MTLPHFAEEINKTIFKIIVQLGLSNEAFSKCSYEVVFGNNNCIILQLHYFTIEVIVIREIF